MLLPESGSFAPVAALVFNLVRRAPWVRVHFFAPLIEVLRFMIPEVVLLNQPTWEDNLWTTEVEDGDTYDVVIVGAGPAGSSAALYAARAKLKTLVVDRSPASGALAITHKIANYPGVDEELTGQELLQRMHRQAARFGARFVRLAVLSVDLSGEWKEVFLPGCSVMTKVLIVATGARGRSRMIPGEEEFLGRGVSYCATCDGAFFEGKRVIVIGDHEESVHETWNLSRIAAHIDFVVPGKSITGVPDDEWQSLPDHVSVHTRTVPQKIVGNGKLEGLEVLNADRQKLFLPSDGIFIFLSGSKPGTDFLKDEIKLDPEGYMEVNHEMMTEVPGVYAIGDARRTPVKQAVIAAADGTLAALSAERYIHKRSRLIAQR